MKPPVLTRFTLFVTFLDRICQDLPLRGSPFRGSVSQDFELGHLYAICIA
jgi:hypothetical protein